MELPTVIVHVLANVSEPVVLERMKAVVAGVVTGSFAVAIHCSDAEVNNRQRCSMLT